MRSGYMDLLPLGVQDGSTGRVLLSAVTNEMPTRVLGMLMRETVRVLRPGGVVGYMDLNPAQILQDNMVANLVSRIAVSNVPYLVEYLETDICAEMGAALLEALDRTWPSKEKYAIGVLLAADHHRCGGVQRLPGEVADGERIGGGRALGRESRGREEREPGEPSPR